MTNQEYFHIISHFVKVQPPKLILKIIGLIEQGELHRNSTIREWSRLLLPATVPANLLHSLVTGWEREDSLSSLAIALCFKSCLDMRLAFEKEIPEVEIAWTGPYPPSSGRLRPTLPVIHSMIDDANRDILMTGYSLTTKSELTRSVIEKLATARLRGVEVKVALHDDGFNVHALRKVWPVRVPLPVILHWGGREGDPMAKLHAKILVIDHREIFVTSANLSYHGFDGNIEVGIRVKSNVAFQIARHFSSLERSGILQRRS